MDNLKIRIREKYRILMNLILYKSYSVTINKKLSIREGKCLSR